MFDLEIKIGIIYIYIYFFLTSFEIKVSGKRWKLDKIYIDFGNLVDGEIFYSKIWIVINLVVFERWFIGLRLINRKYS